MERWVVLSFSPEGTYNTCTYDDINTAIESYNSAMNLLNKGYCKGFRYALILEGSQLPIYGYVPGEMRIGQEYKEVK